MGIKEANGCMERCLQKDEGGLGLKDVRCWNTPLLTKSLWHVHEKKDTLWARRINHIYLRDASVWDRLPKKEDSPLFKRLLRIRDLLTHWEDSTYMAMQKIESWTRRGNVCISLAYNYFKPKGTKTVWATSVWNTCITLKHSFILWLGANSKLLTKYKLQHMDIDRNCVLCGTSTESVQHFFFECTISSNVWRQIKDWLGIRHAMSIISSALKWIAVFNNYGQHAIGWFFKIFSCNRTALLEGLKHVYKVIFTLYLHVLTHYESLALGR